MDGKDLIWVDKAFADKYNKIESDLEKIKCFEEYLSKVSEESKADFKTNLESLEEEAAIYAGLMLKVKQSFTKAKDEALSASYTVWENWDKERPNVNANINEMINSLKPLKTQLIEIDTLVKGINTLNIERFIDVIQKFNTLYGESKDMVEFLIKNYKREA